MNQRQSITTIGGLAAGLLFSGIAMGGTIQCDTDTTKNYMKVDDTLVSACLESGEGNIGNGINDEFLKTPASAGYTDVSGSYSLSFTNDGKNLLGTGTSGTWSIDPTFWDSFSSGAIGFKFGTGGEPDEWFVYSLEGGATGGDWDFFYGSLNKTTGGGLSHLTLYSKEVTVPEPGTIALLGLGLIGLGLARKSRKAA